MDQVPEEVTTAHNLIAVRLMIHGICDLLVSKNLCTAEEVRDMIADVADGLRDLARSESTPAMRASLINVADGVMVSAREFDVS